jgi:hypothetical protein
VPLCAVPVIVVASLTASSVLVLVQSSLCQFSYSMSDLIICTTLNITEYNVM